jgi:hypothetical protein
MNIEDRIALVKDLIRKREEIDQQLADLFGGQTPKKTKCSICGSTEHTARTCPQKAVPEKRSEPVTASVPHPFSALSRLAAGDQENAIIWDGRPRRHHARRGPSSISQFIDHNIDSRIACHKLIAIARARNRESSPVTIELQDAAGVDSHGSAEDRDMRSLAGWYAEEGAALAWLKVERTSLHDQLRQYRGRWYGRRFRCHARRRTGRGLG